VATLPVEITTIHFSIKITLILFDTLVGAGVQRWGFYSMLILMGVGGWSTEGFNHRHGRPEKRLGSLQPLAGKSLC